MFEPTQYPYSLKFSIGTLTLMILLMLLLLRNVLGVNTTFIWVTYGFCTFLFISLAAVIISKRLMPAMKGEIALQLDDDGISDYIRDISIEWTDIKEINLVRGRSAATMWIDLKFESDYGSRVGITLRWVKGNDMEIYETTLAYFEQLTTNDAT